MQPFIVLFLVFCCCCCRLSAFFRRRRNSSSVSSGGCFNDMRAPLEAIIIILLRSFSLSSSSRASKRPRHKSHRPHADDMMMAVPLHAKKWTRKSAGWRRRRRTFASARPQPPASSLDFLVCMYVLTTLHTTTYLHNSRFRSRTFIDFTPLCIVGSSR